MDELDLVVKRNADGEEEREEPRRKGGITEGRKRRGGRVINVRKGDRWGTSGLEGKGQAEEKGRKGRGSERCV